MAVALLALPAAAEAAFPGENGKIAWSSDRDGNHEIYSMDADGSGVLRLTEHLAQDVSPAWSPDGQQLAFASLRSGFNHVWVMNADGTDPHQVSSGGNGGRDPSWSPDGSKLVFASVGGSPIQIVNADGTGQHTILSGVPCPPEDFDPCITYDNPEWSPAGDRIALERTTRFDDPVTGEIISVTTEIVTVGVDGTGLQALAVGIQPTWAPDASRIAYSDSSDVLTIPASGGTATTGASTPGADRQAAWSPDGDRLTFLSNADGDNEIFTSRVGGTELVQLTFNTANDRYPNWQPIPVNSYPRPKGATPFRAALTTAYEPCTSPDRTHGPPLAFPSCAGPQQSSAHLTVGTGDSNGLPARNEGHVRLDTLVGAPGGPDDADVGLELFIDDVFTNALDDYTGEVRAHLTLQITDKDNTPHPGGPGAATTTAIPLDLVASCAAVPDPAEGSVCSATTTADALAPGTVKEGRRAIWQLGRVEVYDGGPDGDAHTPAGDTLFATQGLFVP